MSLDKQVSPNDEDAVSPIVFHLNPGSGVPTYLQLVEQVEQALQLGYLQLGDQLPRVKDVVGVLSINPNTVLKAYRELEYRGVAAGRPGQGTFVVGAPATVGLKELTRLRKRLLSGWLAEATAAGLDRAAIEALFSSVLNELGESVALRRTDRQEGSEVVV